MCKRLKSTNWWKSWKFNSFFQFQFCHLVWFGCKIIKHNVPVCLFLSDFSTMYSRYDVYFLGFFSLKRFFFHLQLGPSFYDEWSIPIFYSLWNILFKFSAWIYWNWQQNHPTIQYQHVWGWHQKFDTSILPYFRGDSSTFPIPSAILNEINTSMCGRVAQWNHC